MMKSIAMIALSLIATNAFAQDYSYRQKSQEARIMAGGKGLSSEFGVEYEKRSGNQGWNVYAQHTQKREAQNMLTGTPEQWVLGLGMPIHLPDSTDFDVYVAPTLALIYQKDVPADGDDVYTAGPALKIGTLYSINPAWTAGVEFVSMTNWFSDKIPSSQTFANAVVGYRF